MRLHYLIYVLLLCSCTNLPQTRHYQYSIPISYEVENDTLEITMNNIIKAPLRVLFSAENEKLSSELNTIFPLILAAEKDSIVRIPTLLSKQESKLKIRVSVVDTTETNLKPISFPFPKNRSYKIMQGYNDSFSHNKPTSRYAIDFTLKEYDTIAAVADGIVVGVVKEYHLGKNDEAWKDYGNFITLYHPEMHAFSQYVHLVHGGAFVKINDRVLEGQPIGLSGKTGFTSKEHLHFNFFKSTDGTIEPLQMTFKTGQKGTDLKIGTIVTH